MASTASFAPWTRFTTPSGIPASWSNSKIRTWESGTRSLGLTMNVFPQAIACGRNHIGTIAGKLKGVIAANTPSGWRKVVQSIPVAMSSSERPCIRDGMPHATSMLSIARRTLLRDSSSVLPCSSVMIRAMSSEYFSNSARRTNSGRIRFTGGVARQAGNARAAA